MKRFADRIPGLFLLLFSGYICLKSFQLGLGSWRKPGSGFVPFWSRLCLGILVLIMLIQNIWLTKKATATEGKEKTNWKAIGLIFVSLSGYILFVEYLGFILTTTIFIVTLLKGIEKKDWFLATWVSLAIAVGSYVVFKVWLQVELPVGIFGF